MRIQVDEKVFARAKEVEPVVREYAAAAERERRLAQPVADALNRTGLTRMLAPKSLGGHETDPVTCARTIEEIATYDTAAAWTLQSNAGAFLNARLPEAGLAEIYDGNPNTMLAAAFAPPIEAVEVSGGFRVKGRRPFASYGHASRWIFLTAVVMADGGPQMIEGQPRVIGLWVPTKDAILHDNWDAMGMRGTDSGDVEVRDVIVPARRTFPMAPQFEPSPAYRGPLYRAPAITGSLACTIPPVALALARLAIHEVVALAPHKTPLASATTTRDRPYAQMQIGRAEAMLEGARALLYDTLGETWVRCQSAEPFPLEHRGRIQMAAVHAVQTAAQVVDAMFEAAGSTAVLASHRIERIFRDAQVIRQHGLVGVNRYGTVGQVLLGLEPDLPLLHL